MLFLISHEEVLKMAESVSSGKGSFGLVAGGILLLFSIAMLYYKMWKQGEKTAEEEHSEDVAKMKSTLDTANKAVQTAQEGRDKAESEAREHEATIDALQAQRDALEKEHEKASEAIAGATTWDELDKLSGHVAGPGLTATTQPTDPSSLPPT
jgi:septal ring factor EnvC (AmiA/AmiB activator)